MYAGIAGGFFAGILTNPIDIVFNRMQVDSMYPPAYRRNYTSFLDGFYKVAEEGALFRGWGANWLRYTALMTSMTGVYDYLKENFYYWFGPTWFVRAIPAAIAVFFGSIFILPADLIRTRLHTMRPLPNG